MRAVPELVSFEVWQAFDTLVNVPRLAQFDQDAIWAALPSSQVQANPAAPKFDMEQGLHVGPNLDAEEDSSWNWWWK